MLIKVLLFWLPMIALAFLNATLRELLFVKYFSDLKAHQLSTLTLSILCVVYTWLVFPFLKITNTSEAFAAGFLWATLTILFEFGLGLATGKRMPELLQQYNLAAGNTWPLFLLILFFAPFIVLRLR